MEKHSPKVIQSNLLVDSQQFNVSVLKRPSANFNTQLNPPPHPPHTPLSLAGRQFLFRGESIIGRSCHSKTFVTTKLLLSRQRYACRDKHNFVVTKVLARQAHFCRDKICVLSRQTRVCHHKSMPVDKIMFVATNICRDKGFVATNTCLLR